MGLSSWVEEEQWTVQGETGDWVKGKIHELLGVCGMWNDCYPSRWTGQQTVGGLGEGAGLEPHPVVLYTRTGWDDGEHSQQNTRNVFEWRAHSRQSRDSLRDWSVIRQSRDSPMGLECKHRGISWNSVLSLSRLEQIFPKMEMWRSTLNSY